MDKHKVGFLTSKLFVFIIGVACHTNSIKRTHNDDEFTLLRLFVLWFIVDTLNVDNAHSNNIPTAPATGPPRQSDGAKVEVSNLFAPFPNRTI